MPATAMYLFESLRVRHNRLECQIDSDNLSRDLLMGMLGFCYTKPSSENECNFNEINSTQIVNNWKLKSCRECECEDDWTFTRE